MPQGREKTHIIVFANEKGGTGKSTTAVHVAIALAAKGARVSALDLDHRQRTLGRYLDNRGATIERTGRALPMPRHETHDGATDAKFEEQFERLSDGADYLVIDTPGRDDPFARVAAQRADTLVTPMNDSFVDFDLIGQVDPDTFKVTRPSFYSELIWDARKARAKSDGSTIDWVVLRNRLQHIEARNMRRVAGALDQLAKAGGVSHHPGTRRTRHLPRVVPERADHDRRQGIRGNGSIPRRRAAGIARDDERPRAARTDDGAVRLMEKFVVILVLMVIGWYLVKPKRKPAKAPALDQVEARAILGVSPDAGTAEIRAAHRRLVSAVPSRSRRLGRSYAADQSGAGCAVETPLIELSGSQTD